VLIFYFDEGGGERKKNGAKREILRNPQYRGRRERGKSDRGPVVPERRERRKSNRTYLMRVTKDGTNPFRVPRKEKKQEWALPFAGGGQEEEERRGRRSFVTIRKTSGGVRGGDLFCKGGEKKRKEHVRFRSPKAKERRGVGRHHHRA